MNLQRFACTELIPDKICKKAGSKLLKVGWPARLTAIFDSVNEALGQNSSMDERMNMSVDGWQTDPDAEPSAHTVAFSALH